MHDHARLQFWSHWLFGVTLLTIAFGLFLMLAPTPTRQGFSLLFYAAPDQLDALGAEATRYISFIHAALGAVGRTPDETWYVGDQHDRDVLCGRRAGVGTVVLMTTRRHPPPPRRRARPDLQVDDPAALGDILAVLFERHGASGRVVA